MNCKSLRRTLAENVLADLSPEIRSAVELHVSMCAACSREYRYLMALESELSKVTFLDCAAAHRPQPRPLWGAGPRLLASVGFAAAALCLGYWLGSRGATLPLPVHEARASVIDPSVRVEGIRDESFESGEIVWHGKVGRLGQWGLRAENLEQASCSVVDDQVARKGKRSLKLYHRAWGANVSQRFNLPIPAGTVVKVAYWVYSPRGGSIQNKLFTASFLAPGLSTSMVHYSSGEHGTWEQQVFEISPAQDSDTFEIMLSTASGRGQDSHGNPYVAFDWATWIDDVEVSFVLRGESSGPEVRGDSIAVEFSLPEPYLAAQVDLATVRLVDNYSKSYQPVTPEQVQVVGSKVRAVFRSRAAVNQLISGNPDLPGEPAVAAISARVKHGECSVPVSVGVCGPPPRSGN